MTGVIQCDACGARNQPDAGWCTQCYEPVGTAATPAVTEVTGPPRSGPPATPPPAGPPPRPASRPSAAGEVDGLLPLPPDGEADDVRGGGTGEPLQAGEGRFRDGAEGLEWRCGTCGEWNSLEQAACTVCRSPFGRGADAAPVRPDVAPALLVAASVALPGAGHALLGMWGQTFVRGSLALVWGIGGLSLLLNALGSGQPVVPAVPLLVGWVVLVATAVNDVLAEAGGSGRVVLHGRLLLWLVMGVIGATMAAAFLGAFTALGGTGA